VFLTAAAVLWGNWFRTGELIQRNIDLSGGTAVTVYTPEVPPGAKETLEAEGYSFREIKSYDTGELIAAVVEAGPEHSLGEVEVRVNQTFPGSSYDVRSVGPAMGESFMQGAVRSLVISFVFMGLILAFIFRQPIVAFTVILSGFLNVFEAAAFMTLFGVRLAPHTIGALLMLMGWSVDSEVLFDTKIFKRRGGSSFERATAAMKTAMTMSMAIFLSLSALYFVSTSSLIRDMALVILLGTACDLLNTWFQSLSMVLWYTEAKA